MRGRVLVAATLLIGGSAVGDRVLSFAPAQTRGVVPTAPSGGVLACPVATMGSGEAYLYLVNTGETTGRARVLVRPVGGAGVEQVRLGVKPGEISTIALHRLTAEPSGVLVEWSGGQIFATHSLKTATRIIGPGRRLPRFAAAAACREPGGPELAFTAGRTDNVGDTTLSLFNPSSAAADVSISVRIDGQFVEPQRLQRRVVKPLSRRDFSLRDFAFGKGEIAVVIRSLSGRVVAEAFIENREGAELVSATPPSSETIALVPATESPAKLSFSGTDLAPVSILAHRYDDGEAAAPEVPPTLGPGVPGQVTLAASTGRAVAYALTTQSAGRVVSATSWSVSGGIGFDLVAASGGTPSTVWSGVAAGMSPGWSTELLVVSAGGESGSVALRVIGPKAREESIELPSGTVRRVVLADDDRPHGFVMSSDSPFVVIVIGRARFDAAGYGFLPVADRAESPTAARGDDSVGVSRRT